MISYFILISSLNKINMNNVQRQSPQAGLQQPLSNQQVTDIYQQQKKIDFDIRENLSEIRMLNNKMAKNDYELTYLHKLQQRERILNNKKRELQDILINHQYLQDQINQSKINQNNFRATLADDYRKSVEEKKLKRELEKKRELEAEQNMIYNNQLIMEAEQRRKHEIMLENKRAALEELAQKEKMKQRQKDQIQREKQAYNTKVQFRNNLQTQKEAIYKQYYNHFMNNQDTLHSVYNDKTAPAVQERERQKQEFLRKEQEQFAKQQLMLQEQRMNKMNNDRDMLRNYLQTQMNEKQRRKSMELQYRRNFNQQMSQYQMTQRQYDLMEKNRKRQQQQRYDKQLATQIQLKHQLHPSVSTQSHRMHNPITNPIDFKMGITNPYVIKEYEQTKEKFVGDRDLKMKNLAAIGNKSIAH